MPTDESRYYLDLKGKLENLSKGIVKHSPDQNFPANISSAAIDQKVAELEEKRKAFVEASNAAHQKSEEFNIFANDCETIFSGISTQLYGLYGKQNLIVEDFGLKRWLKPKGRKAKVNSKAGKQPAA